ncbi:MAG TPA: zf-TFIIB domain-containing protein, partial [Planctomycetota bacterium]|nr:zf-TFIIB domain-containing protein [Planctomycetota bacterium]
RCPECQAQMQRANFQKRSGVIIDRCHEHGTWLDSDELERIAAYILGGGLGAGGYEEYAVKARVDAKVRREAAALARAIKGESIAVAHSRTHDRSRGGFLGMLLKELLD